MAPIAQNIPWSVYINVFLLMLFLSPRDAERFIWNCSVNNSGKKGTNIPLDEATEHSNNFIKQGIGNLGPNVTEKAVSRLSYSEMHTVKILGNLDETIRGMLSSGKHSEGSTKRDLHELVNRAVELSIFNRVQYQSGKWECFFRSENCF